MPSCILIMWLVRVYIVTVFLHIGTIGLPSLARALLTLIGSCRIYYVFKIKAGRFRKRYRSCNRFAKEKSLTITNILWNIASSRIERYTSVDDWRSGKSPATKDSQFILHVFQLNYAAMVDKLIQQEKLNHCHGLTLNNDDDDSNIESCCVTNDARQRPVRMQRTMWKLGRTL